MIDRNRCEGKEDCVRVCPYHVFEMGVLSDEERSTLSWVGRLKAWAHGGKQAFALRAEMVFQLREGAFPMMGGIGEDAV